MIKDIHCYDDIINLPHHVSQKHPPMKLQDRAAQFGAFQALTGHSDAISETGRLTQQKEELTEYAIEILDTKLQLIRDKINEEPKVSITYFKEDEKKSGGAYLDYSGIIKKIDEFNRTLHFAEGLVVPIDAIYDIRGKFFDYDTGFDNW